MSAKALLGFFAGLAVLIGGQAEARTYTLDYYDQEFSSGQSIHLKRDLQRAFPRIDLRDAEIRSVSLEVKSAQGRWGDVTLVVGRDQTDRRSVMSDPRDWNNPSLRTYDNVMLNSYSRDTRGIWQLHFSGDRFKVRRVIVDIEHFSRPTPGPGPGPGPRPGPGDRYTDLACESRNYESVFCAIGFRVTRVELARTYPGSLACVEGRTWFATRDGVEVRNGCRGLFRVYGR